MLQTGREPVRHRGRGLLFKQVHGRRGTAGSACGVWPGRARAKGSPNGRLARLISRTRADTRWAGRQRVGAANSIRTGQVGRAASLTGAGLSAYDTLSKMLSGPQRLLQRGASSAPGRYRRTRAIRLWLPYAQKLYGGLAEAGERFWARGVGGAYDKLFGLPNLTSEQIATSATTAHDRAALMVGVSVAFACSSVDTGAVTTCRVGRLHGARRAGGRSRRLRPREGAG